MTSNTPATPATIVAVTSQQDRHRSVVERATAIAGQTGATVILYHLGADLGIFESPLPTEWSGQGEREQFGDRLDASDLEAAGQGWLADQVRVVRAAGVEAWGWLPSKADADSLSTYAADQGADLLLVSTEDRDLIGSLRERPTVEAGVRATSSDRPAKGPGDRIHVEAVPPD